MWFARKHTPDITWFENLVHSHVDELTAFAYRLSGNREQAEDLVQETFAEAWKGISALNKQEAARAWLFRVLRRRYARLVKTRLNQPDALPMDSTTEEMVTQIASPQGNPHTHASSADYLAKALAALDEKFRVPLLMATLEGFTVTQISQELGIPSGTVLSRIHRARQSLQQIAAQLDQVPTSPPANVLDMHTLNERRNHGS